MKSDTSAPSLMALGFDPGLVLLKETATLLDPRFLGALHGEIESQLGHDEAISILLQIGFVNGLRDAYRVVDAGLAPGRGHTAPAVPALGMRFRMRTAASPRGALEAHGTWPDRTEAAARLARDGKRPDCGCFLSLGYTSGWLSGTLDADILAIETDCAATGAESCCFVAREAEAWRADGDTRAAALLRALPFEACRSLARTEVDGQEDASAGEDAKLDRDAAVVHIWGPVMVIPYSGADEALQAVDLIGNDPSARHVSVIVVDLGGAIVDDAFGAVALEQIVETAETWGAETIFADVSPLSEPVVAELVRQPLIVRKDLHEAIALAFQIARSQRADL